MADGPTAWVSVAWANAKTLPVRPRSARRSLAHQGFESKENVNQAHVHCKPELDCTCAEYALFIRLGRRFLKPRRN